MANIYNENHITQLKHLASLATITKNELSETFRSASVSGNTVSFFNSKDGTGNAAFTFNFPEEIFLDQLRTTFESNFEFDAETYPGATDPDLDGKPVFVIAVKGDDAISPTLTYSFINLESLINAYMAGNNSIDVNGYNISVKISAEADNLLELKNNGLYVGSDDTKLDKVTNAGLNNFAIFGASGAIVDSGITFATDADVTYMLNGIFGVAGGGSSSINEGGGDTPQGGE